MYLLHRLDPLIQIGNPRPVAKAGPVDCIIEEVAIVFGHRPVASPGSAAKAHKWVIGRIGVAFFLSTTALTRMCAATDSIVDTNGHV